MNMTETIALLAGIAEFQPQATDEVAAQMWARTLNSDMGIEFALDYATTHFARSKEPLRPADFNAAWREQQERDYWMRIQQQPRAISQDPETKPMPDYVRQKWEQIRSRGGE